jgi:adenylate cyclase
MSIDDGDPDTLAAAGVITAFLVGDCESAIEIADRAVALNPSSYWAWNDRGWVHRIAGLLEEAVQSFERAFRMSPVDPGLYHSLNGIGYAFIELGRLDEGHRRSEEGNSSEPLLFGGLPLSRIRSCPSRS